MDELPYFMLSDVKNDPELRALFTECGCGHLFDLAKVPERDLLSFAQETRRHLKMPFATRDRVKASP